MAESDQERAEREQENQEREAALKRVPPLNFDQSKWPSTVRQITGNEAGGPGIDPNGRLHWDGKPVEIIGQRLDLTKGQFVIAFAVAAFTGISGYLRLEQSFKLESLTTIGLVKRAGHHW